MKFKFRSLQGILSAVLLISSTHAFAAVYKAPPKNQSLIGEDKIGYVKNGDTVAQLAQIYDVGFNEMQNANPNVDLDTDSRYSKQLTIPTKHLLPNTTRKGIVVNLPEMRMYFYKNDDVLTYPIGIGKIGNTIPIQKAKVTRKREKPFWYPPKDIREFNLKKGIILPRVMPPGPDNPLGEYAIYMSIPTYLMHSTIYPESVGRRASFGCIRMYVNDIENLFPSIEKGIPIEIINQPVKLGWQDKDLYIEAHKPMKEHVDEHGLSMQTIVHNIAEKVKDKPVLINWQEVEFVAEAQDGRPHSIGAIIN